MDSAPLVWAGAARLPDMGVPKLNLGGGARRDDGIAEFDKRFGAMRLRLGALKQMYRPHVFLRRAGRLVRTRTAAMSFSRPTRRPTVVAFPF